MIRRANESWPGRLNNGFRREADCEFSFWEVTDTCLLKPEGKGGVASAFAGQCGVTCDGRTLLPFIVGFRRLTFYRQLCDTEAAHECESSKICYPEKTLLCRLLVGLSNRGGLQTEGGLVCCAAAVSEHVRATALCVCHVLFVCCVFCVSCRAARCSIATALRRILAAYARSNTPCWLWA